MNNLELLRRKKGLTQVQLARELGVAVGTVVRLEKKGCHPGLLKHNVVLKLEAYFGLPVAKILSEVE